MLIRSRPLPPFTIPRCSGPSRNTPSRCEPSLITSRLAAWPPVITTSPAGPGYDNVAVRILRRRVGGSDVLVGRAAEELVGSSPSRTLFPDPLGKVEVSMRSSPPPQTVEAARHRDAHEVIAPQRVRGVRAVSDHHVPPGRADDVSSGCAHDRGCLSEADLGAGRRRRSLSGRHQQRHGSAHPNGDREPAIHLASLSTTGSLGITLSGDTAETIGQWHAPRADPPAAQRSREQPDECTRPCGGPASRSRRSSPAPGVMPHPGLPFEPAAQAR